MTDLNNIELKKCINNLEKEGVTFELDQEETNIVDFYGNVIGRRKLGNVVFKYNGKVTKIVNELFFRQYGIISIFEPKKSKKKGEDNFIKLLTITDQIFYDMQYQRIKYYLIDKPKNDGVQIRKS